MVRRPVLAGIEPPRATQQKIGGAEGVPLYEFFFIKKFGFIRSHPILPS